MLKYFKILLAAPLLASCMSGSGDGGGDTKTTLKGTSRAAHADVSVLEWDGAGGNVIASTTTGRDGNFSVRLDGTISTVLVEIQNGNYINPATGDQIQQNGSSLTAVVPAKLTDGGASISVTGYTTWAQGLAEYQATQGADQPATKAIEQITNLVGFDPLTTTAHGISDETTESESQDGINYGLMNAAVAELVRGASTSSYSVPGFSDMVAKDLRHDGKLNGESQNGSLFFNGQKLSVTTYRHGIAENLLVAAAGDQNNTGQGVSAVLPFAKSFNQRSSPLYPGDTEVIPLESDAPSITNLSHRDGFVVTGDLALSASVVDAVGLNNVALYIDGVFHASRGGNVNPVFQVDTSTLTNQNHDFRLVAENKIGATTEKTITLQVANDAPTITQVTPQSEYVRGTRAFSADVSKPPYVGIQEVDFTISGTSFNPVSATDPEVQFDTTSISNGVHQFKIEVTDSVGNQVNKTVSFQVDNANPTGSLNLSEGAVLSRSETINADVSDNVRVQSASVILDGTEVHHKEGNDLTEISTSIDTEQYQDGSHTIALQVIDHAGNLRTVNKEVEFLNSAPNITLDNPLDGDVIESSFQVAAELESPDNVDESVKFLIDGEVYSTALPNRQNITSEFNINNYPDGEYTFEVQATNKAGFTTSKTAEVTLQQGG